MEKTLEFYENFTWDMVRVPALRPDPPWRFFNLMQTFARPQTVQNSVITISQLKHDVIDVLSIRSPRFKVCLPRC